MIAAVEVTVVMVVFTVVLALVVMDTVQGFLVLYLLPTTDGRS